MYGLDLDCFLHSKTWTAEDSIVEGKQAVQGKNSASLISFHVETQNSGWEFPGNAKDSIPIGVFPQQTNVWKLTQKKRKEF